MNIHPLALVDSRAEIGRNVTIGPFCVIEAEVVIEQDCQLNSHVVVKNGTHLGPANQVAEGAVLGGLPQHTRIPQHPGRLQVGCGNTIREYCTLHRALHEGAATVVGDRNLLMAGTHVAHDCRVGSHVIIANNTLLAGHVLVEDRAFISGAVAVHQFCRIGSLAMIGGHARVVQDVPPFMTVDGITGCIVGLNLVGLRRNGYNSSDIADLKQAYRVIYRSGLPWREVLARLKAAFPAGAAAQYWPFLTQGTRGFVQERRMPPNATLKLRLEGDDPQQLRAAS